MKNDQLVLDLKAIADPLRLSILKVLGQHSLGVLELTHLFAVKQSGMSHHLKTLAQGEWVTKRREGNSLFYRRTLSANQSWRQEILKEVDALQLEAEVVERLREVEQNRIETSKEFFQRNAERMKERQDLIAEYHQYGEEVWKALQALPQLHRDHVVEVGPGEGEFLRRLAGSFHQALAIELSPRILSIAQSRLAEFDNIEWLEGTTADVEDRLVNTDLIVYNMVLHHVPSPAEEIQRSAKLLKTGGLLVITDLCQHEQDWAKERCGDLWLGFDDQQLDEWAQTADLNKLNTVYLGLKNGFQIQIQIYQK